MEDPLHVLIVGHDLQTKCNIANALIKQKSGFRQFLCRQNMLVKKVVGTRATTVAGKQLNIVLTPNLNTPAWTHLTDGILKRYRNKIFVYVKSPSQIKVNDNNSIGTIKKTFGKSQIQVISYFADQKAAESTQPENILFHGNMTFSERRNNADKLLSTIGKTLQSQISHIDRGQDEVGATSEEQKPVQTNPKPPLPNDSKEDTDGYCEPILARDDTSELEVQENIEANDWDLLNRTLRYGRAKSNHVRVNIIGNQGAGKTTLFQRLHNIDVKCPNDQQKPTEALEIKELSSRCIEIEGQKHWETNEQGYEGDLNVQRMAQAMKFVQADLEGNTDTKSPDIKEEDFDANAAEYTLSSYVEEDIEIHREEPYSAINKEKSRVHYLKKILRKKNLSRGERMYISYWDFAGQSTYYSTHQVFMSPSAVYVLVVDLSVDFNEKLSDSLNFRTGIIKDCSVAESLMFWISSIKAFTSDTKGGIAPVLIVGTHIDKVKVNAVKEKRDPEEIICEKFDEVREILKMSEMECIAIDNTNPDIPDLAALRNRILELGLGVIDEEIPAQWIDLERRIQEHKIKGTVIMTFSDLQLLDEGMDVPMKDKARLEAFLGHQHNRGHLIHFLHDDLRDLIILEPDVLAKFLNNLMRSRDSDDQRGMKQHSSMYNHNGIINRNYVIETAKMMTEYKGIKDNVDNLLNMLIHLSVIRPYQLDNGDDRFLLPCLLPHRPVKELGKECKNKRNFQVVFPNNHMPPTFYHILVGGLLNEWKPIQRNIDAPEIYNLHACFQLDRETHQMEICWKESRVYIDLLNYSTKESLTGDKIFKILDIVEKRIVQIFRVYRHTNRNYDIRVLCPIHNDSFASVSTLKNDGEAMCYHANDTHAVAFEDVFGMKFLEKKKPEFLKRKPTDKDLGRLSRYLHRENATSLASRLMLPFALIEADRAAHSNLDENSQRLYILIRWRGRNGAETLEGLIHRLAVTGDYQWECLQKQVERHPERQKYDIPDELLDTTRSKGDLIAAADSVGALYPFLMLELGLCFKDIEVVRENNPNDMQKIIFTLLEKWRQQHPKDCTTRNLLDTTHFVGIDTTQIQKMVKSS